MAVIRKYIDTVALDYYHRYWVNPRVRHLQNVANVTITFAAQTLTDEQKAQARLNIGAAAAAVLGDYLPRLGGKMLGGISFGDASTSWGTLAATSAGALQWQGNTLITSVNAVTLGDAQTITGAKTFQGAVIVPTPAANDDSQKAATTAWVRSLIGTIADLEQESF
jgi:hypothetical protein